jgi:hypothetical protein
MFRIEQFVLVLFVVGLLSIVPFGMALGQEVPGETVSEPVQSEVTTTKILEDVPQDTQGDIAVDGNQEVVDVNSSTTQNTILDTLPTTDTSAEPAVPAESTPELVETQPVSIPLETISQAIASSSSNENLPFKLTSSKMNFAINEVPIFTFSYTSKKTEGVVESFIESMISVVTNTVSDVYEGSFVEAIVEAVGDTVSSVVDFFIPTAEGQEVLFDTLREDAVSVEPVTSPVEQPVAAATVAQVASSTEIESATSSRIYIVQEDAVVSATTSTTTAQISFAIVDGIRHPVYVTYTEDETFVVDMQSTVFTVGVHTLELHLLFKEKMYVAYYTFSVDGTVISTRLLKEGVSVVVVADTDTSQTLWLVEQGDTGAYSFQKIADETTMSQNPVLEFNDDTLFWTSPTQETLIGFDIVSRVPFSQTLNLKSRDQNILKLQLGSYDVSVSPEDIDVIHLPNTP